ncbi:MAG: twin-arginine translocation signal domain-containing protein [Chromatiaceae bacterium]|nr:twin-arginine translocation signal domain-containing protein [Chromatiaceae bacterium]MBP8282634.1 twin-arginine translocation signal domain-containing protein [Chromatiaceae bacterium]MBP8288621.1 twin-arginine translocation signal domain-containing protein [Chromatiaceae bacterium]MBP9603199.1 twin-arginine translocation signal domain-containing protein [Chromatiaceae bacterium]
MTTRRNFLTTATLLAVTMPLASDLALANPAEAKPQLMFVQTAEDMKADDKTLRLVNVGQQTLYFSDRPVRIAGHIAMPAYLEEWTAAAGKDNFSNDPPNATLSVYEPGDKDNALAVVEISHPVVEGNDLAYHYKLIEGPMPKSGGATALFIDWIGVGGGVGPGFHGVGRGGRGVGLR